MQQHTRAFRSQRTSIVALIVLALPLACTSSQQDSQTTEQPNPNQLPLNDRLIVASARVALPPPGIAPSQLPAAETQGAKFIVKYCATCHALPTPKQHSVTDWPRVTRRMWLRMDRIDSSFHVPVPSSGERMLMLNYLLDNALRVSEGDLPPGPERPVFMATCSQCHDLPDPRTHSPDDWPATVRRMMGHMELMLGTTLTPNEYHKVVLYLQSASK
ncbi:MAG: c-type cytochrome [Gemmatimonadales bacterium]